MYLRKTKQRNKGGSAVNSWQLACNLCHINAGMLTAQAIRHFGRADQFVATRWPSGVFYPRVCVLALSCRTTPLLGFHSGNRLTCANPVTSRRWPPVRRYTTCSALQL
jgi:hypothetical protein